MIPLFSLLCGMFMFTCYSVTVFPLIYSSLFMYIVGKIDRFFSLFFLGWRFFLIFLGNFVVRLCADSSRWFFGKRANTQRRINNSQCSWIIDIWKEKEDVCFFSGDGWLQCEIWPSKYFLSNTNKWYRRSFPLLVHQILIICWADKYQWAWSHLCNQNKFRKRTESVQQSEITCSF